MLFNSIEFLFFILLVWLVYWQLPLKKQNTFLLLASYFFYAWWDWRFLGLLWLSSITDYYCACCMESAQNAKTRKKLLSLSIFVNLGILCTFKYFNFFRNSLASLLSLIGFQHDWPTLYIVLPVGISFYTFQTLSYTIDVYRGELKACRSIKDFALYVSFFPQLVAGPIERATRLLPQIQKSRTCTRSDKLDGLGLLLTGYLKKVVIADQLAGLVSAGFSSPDLPVSGMGSWGIVFAFALQIYGDFSGYSDIARGVAKLLGFELMLNFGRPYLVLNISDFWKHWHISLSTWLRDYLFIPLGGSRGGPSRTLVNLVLVMFLGGLWHGAGWGFILWGLYIGFLLVGHRLYQGVRLACPWLNRMMLHPLANGLSIGFTFLLVCFGWMIFRSASAPSSVEQIQLMAAYASAMTTLSWSGEIVPFLRGLVALGGLSFLLQARYEWFEKLSAWPSVWRAGYVGTVTLVILVLGKADGTDFIYFQF